MANNISVSVTADIADLVAKRAVLSAELKAATADLNGFAKTAASTGMTDALKASMLSAASAVAPLRTEIKALDAEMKASAATAQVEAGSIKGLAESFGAARGMIAGFGGAMTAALALGGITAWAAKMGEGGEKIEHTAQILGTSVGNVQQLNAAFTMMGVSTDKGVFGIERLDKAFAAARSGSKQQEEAFKELGVSTAKNYHGMELLGAVMDGFSKQANGPAKAAEAMNLFGRAGAALIPFLDLGSAGLAEINRETAEYGVKNDDAAAKAAQLGAAFNENRVAGMGLSNVMAQGFAPVLTLVVQGINQMVAGFIQSYEKGGMAKTAMDVLVGSFKALVSAAVIIGSTIVAAFDVAAGAVATWKDDFKLVYDEVTGELRQLGDDFVGLGKVIYDALTQNVIAAGRDMKTAEDKMAQDAKDTAAKIKGDLASIGKDAAPGFGAGWSAILGGEGFIAGMGGPPKKQKGPSGEGDEGDTSGDAKGGKKGHGESQVGQWTEQLHEQELAAAASSGDYMKNEEAAEIAFWQAKLATTTTNSKTWFEVQDKLFSLLKQQQTEAYNSLIAGDKEKIAADQGSHAAELADWAKYLADVANAYGKQSAEYKAALAEQVRAEEDYDRQITAKRLSAIEEQTKAAAKAVNDQNAVMKAGVEDQIAALKLAYDAGRISRADEQSDIEALQARETASVVAGYQAQINANDAAFTKMASVGGATLDQLYANWKKYRDENVALQQDIARANEDLDRQLLADQSATISELRSSWSSMVNPMVSTFSNGMLAMAEHTKSLGQVMAQVGQGMLTSFIGIIDKMVVQWAWGQTTQLMASQSGQAILNALGLTQLARAVAQQQVQTAAVAAAQATQTSVTLLGAASRAEIEGAANVKSVTGSAAAAAAGAYKAMAGIPVIGPALGAVAAAVTFAAVEAFGAQASAAGGFDVPAGSSPLTQLHPEEMVLPAKLANPMRDMLGGQSANENFANNNGGSWGGDLHIHAIDAKSFRDMLSAHPDVITNAVNSGLRSQGKRPL